MLIKSIVLKKEMKMDFKLAKLILLMPGRDMIERIKRSREKDF